MTVRVEREVLEEPDFFSGTYDEMDVVARKRKQLSKLASDRFWLREQVEHEISEEESGGR